MKSFLYNNNIEIYSNIQIQYVTNYQGKSVVAKKYLY